MRGAVAAETDKLKHETPKGRRIKPPFFFERPFQQSEVGELIGRSAAFTSRIKFIVQADKRHCSVTRSMSRLYVRLKLCSAFWWEKLLSHQIFRSLSTAKYSGAFRFFTCSCLAPLCSCRSTLRLFGEVPAHCCWQGQLLQSLLEARYRFFCLLLQQKAYTGIFPWGQI